MRSRSAPVARSEGIVATIHPENDVVEHKANRLVLNTLILKITVVARADIPDQQIDTAVNEIHATVMRDQTVGGLAALIVPEETTWDFEMADMTAVAVEMKYRIRYAPSFDDLTELA